MTKPLMESPDSSTESCGLSVEEKVDRILVAVCDYHGIHVDDLENGRLAMVRRITGPRAYCALVLRELLPELSSTAIGRYVNAGSPPVYLRQAKRRLLQDDLINQEMFQHLVNIAKEALSK